jgi:tetratricopeptide (TPR) repeat protein
VFIGGCTFEAAEAVADTKRDLGVDIIDGIESLVHKSLLQLIESHDDEARLAMMETVREYGFERLVESGEENAARKAHAAYYLVLAEEAANAIEGADQPIWIDRLDRDRGNLRAALDWLTRTGNAEWGLRLASALLRYWELRELFVEGRRRLSALLALPGAAATTPLRAKGLFAAGALAAGQRDYRHQMPLFQESLQIYREQGDRQGMGIAMNAIAIALKDQGDVAEARRIFEEISLIWMDLGDNLLHARALSNLASILKEQGDIVAALARYDEALGIFRQLGDDQGVAWTLRHQGDIARDQCDFELGESLYLQSLAVFRNLADEWSAGSLLTDLGGLALSHGEVSRGIDFFRQATDAFQQHGGHRRGLARVLEGFALAASLDGDAQRAIRLAGAAAALRNALGTPLTPAEQRQVTSGLEIAHAQLSPAARSQAWGEGWTMTLDQAIEFGLNAGV